MTITMSTLLSTTVKCAELTTTATLDTPVTEFLPPCMASLTVPTLDTTSMVMDITPILSMPQDSLSQATITLSTTMILITMSTRSLLLLSPRALPHPREVPRLTLLPVTSSVRR